MMNDEIRMSNDELPASWSMCEIGEISLVVGGGTPPSKDPANFVTPNGGTPWITPADLSRYREIYISHGARNLTEKGCANSAAKMLPKNALLFSSRAPVGYVAIASNPVCTNQGFKSFVLPSGFDPRFGYFYLRHIKPIAEAMATGTTFKELSGAAAAKLPFVIAPLAEQKRIADKLEAVLGRVDACRARLDRLPALLKRFRQSVLAAATLGKLTEEWRMTNRVSDEWEDTTVGSIITRVEAGLNVQCDERPPRSDERGLVKISAVTWGTYDDEKSKTLPTHVKVPDSTRIRVGDFLISRANTLELVGACVIVHKVTRPVFLSDKILRLVLPDAIKPWLLIVLQSPPGRQQIESLATGNQLSMRNLAQANLRQILVPNPSSSERQEIVRRVEDLFAFADRIEARLAVAQKTIERLTPSVLA